MHSYVEEVSFKFVSFISSEVGVMILGRGQNGHIA